MLVWSGLLINAFLTIRSSGRNGPRSYSLQQREERFPGQSLRTKEQHMKRLSGILTLSAFIVGLGSLRGYSCDLGTNWQDEPNDVWLDMDCGSAGSNTGNLGDGGFNRFTGIANSGPVQSASSMQSIDTRQNPGVSPDYFAPLLPSGVQVVNTPAPVVTETFAPAPAPASIDPANNPFDPFSSSVPSSIGDVASAALVPSFPIMQSPTAFQDPGYLALVAPTAPVLAAPDPVAAPVVVAAVQTPLQQAVFGALPAAPAFQDSVPTVDAAGNPNDVPSWATQVTAQADPVPTAVAPTQVAYAPTDGVPTFTATAVASNDAPNTSAALQNMGLPDGLQVNEAGAGTAWQVLTVLSAGLDRLISTAVQRGGQNAVPLTYNASRLDTLLDAFRQTTSLNWSSELDQLINQYAQTPYPSTVSQGVLIDNPPNTATLESIGRDLGVSDARLAEIFPAGDAAAKISGAPTDVFWDMNLGDDSFAKGEAFLESIGLGSKESAMTATQVFSNAGSDPLTATGIFSTSDIASAAKSASDSAFWANARSVTEMNLADLIRDFGSVAQKTGLAVSATPNQLIELMSQMTSALLTQNSVIKGGAQGMAFQFDPFLTQDVANATDSLGLTISPRQVYLDRGLTSADFQMTESVKSLAREVGTATDGSTTIASRLVFPDQLPTLGAVQNVAEAMGLDMKAIASAGSAAERGSATLGDIAPIIGAIVSAYQLSTSLPAEYLSNLSLAQNLPAMVGQTADIIASNFVPGYGPVSDQIKAVSGDPEAMAKAAPGTLPSVAPNTVDLSQGSAAAAVIQYNSGVSTGLIQPGDTVKMPGGGTIKVPVNPEPLSTTPTSTGLDIKFVNHQ
jgi:hypothetical protein